MEEHHSITKRFKIPKIDYINISGFSQSSFRTGFIIEPYNICLDAGIPTKVKPNIILITHGHLDHIASLHSLLYDNYECPIICPSEIHGHITKMIQAFYCMNNNIGGKKLNLNFIHEPFSFNIGKNNFQVVRYDLDHRVPTYAYGIHIIKRQLKEIYMGKSGKEIGELRKTTDIYENLNISLLLYCCDTGKSALHHINMGIYPIIFIECTFIDPEHIEESISRKHLHWCDIEPYVQKYKDSQFNLIHFSRRYSNEKIKVFSLEIKEKYKNVEFWI
jgi:ribonuclease BN (tRNA processing enzyme)